jgi:hypothetical protein
MTAEQVSELVAIYKNVQATDEGGVTFYFLPSLAMPQGASPATVDAVLCPARRDGYESRLFVAAPVTPARASWNGAIRLLERNWMALSWRTQPGLRLAQMVSAHLDAFRAG